MTHTMQPGVRPPDFNSLINGLLTTDAPLPRRLQTASTLRTVLCAPEHAAFVQRDSSQLLNALEQLLYDRTEPIRQEDMRTRGTLERARDTTKGARSIAGEQRESMGGKKKQREATRQRSNTS